MSQPPDPEYYLLRKKITDPNEGRDAGTVSRSLHIYDGEAVIILRGTARPDVMASWIRTVAAHLDRTVPVTISTMWQRMQAVSGRPRFSAVLLSIFASFGVLLAAGGLYGLISFLVIQRTREVGVRIAVGATPRQIVQLILSHALRGTAGGIIIGLLGTEIAARSLRSLLFHVSPQDFTLFASAALLMISVVVAAALGPSLQASRVDPVMALRHE